MRRRQLKRFVGEHLVETAFAILALAALVLVIFYALARNLSMHYSRRMTFRRLVRDRLARRLGVPEIPPALERMKANGFTPNHIFDVGAYRGDFAKLCRRLWPYSQITCFDVQPTRLTEITALGDPKIEVREFLLGDAVKSVAFYEAETSSGIFLGHGDDRKPTRFVPMRTIDSLGMKPDFIKIDVQGAEYEVLKGAETTLATVSAVLAEVNLIDICKGAKMLDELIALLRSHDFVTYDICGLTRRPRDNALWQADFIFVKIESPLRSNKGWQ